MRRYQNDQDPVFYKGPSGNPYKYGSPNGNARPNFRDRNIPPHSNYNPRSSNFPPPPYINSNNNYNNDNNQFPSSKPRYENSTSYRSSDLHKTTDTKRSLESNGAFQSSLRSEKFNNSNNTKTTNNKTNNLLGKKRVKRHNKFATSHGEGNRVYDHNVMRYNLEMQKKCPYIPKIATNTLFITGISSAKIDTKKILNFFESFGEVERIVLSPHKCVGEITYYDIRHAVIAFNTLKTLKFGDDFLMRGVFIENYNLHSIKIQLVLIGERNKHLTMKDVCEFARNFGDYYFIENSSNNGYIIQYYDYRQTKQLLSLNDVTINDTKFRVCEYFDRDEDKTVETERDVTDAEFEAARQTIFRPNSTTIDEYHARLIDSICKKFDSFVNGDPK